MQSLRGAEGYAVVVDALVNMKVDTMHGPSDSSATTGPSRHAQAIDPSAPKLPPRNSCVTWKSHALTLWGQIRPDTASLILFTTSPTPPVTTMTALDSNTWYRVNSLNNADTALTEGGVQDDGTAQTFISTFVDKSPSQQWQFYPAPHQSTTNSDLYFLRSRALGSEWTLNVWDFACHGGLSDCGISTEGLVPDVQNRSEPSAMWAWAPWNDREDTFFLYNAGNGTGFILDLMDPSSTGDGQGLKLTTAHDGGDSQRWTVESVGQIEDISFSTVCAALVDFCVCACVDRVFTDAFQPSNDLHSSH